jgi:hypothetical protein
LRTLRMYHKFLISITAVGITCASIPTAWAADPQIKKSQAKGTASHLVALPKAIAGFFTGAIIGTPICFVRKFPQEVNQGAHGFVGSIKDHDDNKLLLIPASIAWLPVAGFITALEAPAYAVKDAYIAKTAFSKEQFSLGELDP